MRSIYLHGAPGREHGRHWRLDVASPAEAVRALMALRPALREVFRKGNWRVIVGRPRIRNGIDASCLRMNMGDQDLHIVPTTAPRGDDIGSVAMIVVGVILIAVVTVLTWGAATAPATAGVTAGWGAAFSAGTVAGISYGSIALMGLTLVASGIAGLLASRPETQGQATDQADAPDRPSFFFNGVVNNTQQGGPVPLVFGSHLVGSIVISGSLNVEQIAV